MPEVIGATCSTYDSGPSFGRALDVASGKHVPWGGSDVEGWSLLYCEPPFLTVKHVQESDLSSANAWIDKDHVTDTSHIEAWSGLYKTKKPLWAVSVKGSVQEVQRAKGCALVHSVARDRFHFWSAFSLSSGEPCKTIPEAEIEPAVDAARFDFAHRQPVNIPQTVDGVTYALAEIPGSPPKLTLSASRGEAVLWTTALPARGVEGLSMAVAEGVVVVAATDLRTGRNLRLFGVETANGRVRYVHRHPVAGEERIDMLAAGPVVLVWSGYLAGIVPASGEIAWLMSN